MMITFLFLCFTQGSQIVSVATMVHNVKILAITQLDLSLDVVINFLKCFPCLEKLNIQVSTLFICINYFVTQYSIDTCSRVDCHYF